MRITLRASCGFFCFDFFCRSPRSSASAALVAFFAFLRSRGDNLAFFFDVPPLLPLSPRTAALLLLRFFPCGELCRFPSLSKCSACFSL